jgi:hypothetical protein
VLAVAMGIQNAAARKLAVPDLTTTVLTMTLTGIGADSRSGRPGHVTLARRVLVVATMLAGGPWRVAGAPRERRLGAGGRCRPAAGRAGGRRQRGAKAG